MVDQKVSHYEIREKLGAGGMGVVYRAYDTKLERDVALKFLSTSSSLEGTAKRRFLREARAASSLQHRNICTIHEIGETPDGQMFICMEYYEGLTLQELIAGGPLDVPEAIRIALEVASGLAKAHEKEIVHRDIKSSNIIVTEDGEVKILDFGLAKLARATTMTDSGVALGTVGYMSPEQVQGQDLDPRSDIFSLGVVLYEMITGHLPFEADQSAAIGYRLLNEEAPPLRTYRPNVPGDLQSVIDRALAKPLSDRYRSTRDCHTDLLEVLSGLDPNRAVTYSRTHRTRRSLRRPHYAAVAGAALIAAAFLGYRTNWTAILEVFGLNASQATVGIVVFPFSAESDETATAILAAGVRYVVLSAFEDVAGVASNEWVLPEAKVRGRPNASPANAWEQFGTAVVVTGRVAPADNGFAIEIDVSDGQSSDVLETTSFRILRTNAADLIGAVHHLVDGITNGDAIDDPLPSSSGAYHAYLIGVGYAHGWGEHANPDSAIYYLERSVRIDSLFAPGEAELGYAYYKKSTKADDGPGWIRRALEHCDRALARDSSLTRAHITKGLAYSRQGKSESAVESYTNALHVDPGNISARRRLARLFQKSGRVEDAERAYLEAVRVNPTYWGAHEDIGYYYYSTGRFGEAVGPFLRVTQLAPNYQRTYNYLGAVYYALERWEDAIDMFERSFALEKTYQACANLGTLYYMQGRFQDAAQMYEWAWEYDKTDHMVLGNLAAALYWFPDGSGRERAATFSRQAIELARQERAVRPRDPVLIAKMAGYFTNLAETDSARLYVEKALALGPDNPEVLYRAAHAYEMAGERAGALVLIGKAIEQGYSIREIESEPGFKGLTEDARYQLLRKGVAKTDR